MRDLDNDRDEERVRMRDEAGAQTEERIPQVQDVLELRRTHENSRTRQPLPRPHPSSVLGAWAHDINPSRVDRNGHRISRDLSCEPDGRASGSVEAKVEIYHS